jgi:hypothetical protein
MQSARFGLVKWCSLKIRFVKWSIHIIVTIKGKRTNTIKYSYMFIILLPAHISLSEHFVENSAQSTIRSASMSTVKCMLLLGGLEDNWIGFTHSSKRHKYEIWLKSLNCSSNAIADKNI